MAMANNYENMTPCKTCRCGEGDKNIWTTKTSDNDKPIQKCPNCQVLKCGTLFLSSKGIGWTSWKKRWFILTRTSLVFYRSDPNATPQKGNETNLTLGGIDLNNSGSVVVKAEKKLLTVLFPDGRDGRTFTLKAETSEDLHEWRTALENALAQAPSPALGMGQNGVLRNDVADSVESSVEQWKDRKPVKSLVVGRPVLLALEDIDGSPSFLEKALRFIEEHGINVEGILRQAADVEEVERRVREYEQGKVEFSSDEDAHVVGDCIKHILRELPSSPVPATSCTALVEAYRTDRGSRISSMRAAITETFPEPNRRLVQRILKMMRTVASHKSVNRMTLSAVAACMAPLLLRPLLAGDCELEDDFNMGGDGSLQLLQAAAAANHAQAIVIILLEEYERIFDEDILEEVSVASDLYSESEDGSVVDEQSTDNGSLDDDPYNEDDDSEYSQSRTVSERNSDVGAALYDNKAAQEESSCSSSLLENETVEVTKTVPTKTLTPVVQLPTTDTSLEQHVHMHKDDNLQTSHLSSRSIAECTNKSNEPLFGIKQPAVWGRTPGRKNLSMESIEFSGEDELAIQRLEMTKDDLQTKIANEVKGNEILQASLEKRKDLLHERRSTLQQDVERLQAHLQKEMDVRACLEAALMNLEPGQLPLTSSKDSKTRENLEEISLAEADISNLQQKATELHEQLSHQKQDIYAFLCESCSRQLYMLYQSEEMKQKKDVYSTTLVHKKGIQTKKEDPSSGLAVESLLARKQGSPSSSNREPSGNQQLTSQTQNSDISSGFNGPAVAKTPRAVDEHVHTQILDSPSSPKSRFPDSSTKKSSSRKEKFMVETESGNVKTQTGDSPSSPDKKATQKLQPNRTNDRSTKYMGSISLSSKEPTICRQNSASNKSSPMDENSMHGAGCKNSKTQNQDFPSSPNKQSLQKSQSETSNRNNKSLVSNFISSTEEPTGFDHNSASIKSSFSNEPFEMELSFQNSIVSRGFSGASSEEPKTVGHDGPSKKHTSKGEPNTINQSGNKSLGPSIVSNMEEPAIFGRSTASKKSSSRGETLKVESQDPLPSSNRLSSHKHQSNITHISSMKTPGPGTLSSSDETTSIRNAGYRRFSTKGEETAPSTSSALAKLTNRLNFLKERRVQLVNELQNLDASRTFGSESLPPRNDSR